MEPMESDAPSCPGCGGVIYAERVLPPEDDTQPWNACLPPDHKLLKAEPRRLVVTCGAGHICEIRLSPIYDAHCEPAQPHQTTSPAEQHVEMSPLLSYHDKLIKEYYDFDAEWALIKEICPEVEESAPTAKPAHPVLSPLWRGVKQTAGVLTFWAIFVGWLAGLAYVLDGLVASIF
jgi:hypothetical protein